MTALQMIRKECGFKSAASMAEAIGIPKSTYTHYEQGDSEMPLDVAWNLADILGCTLDELVGRTPYKGKEHSEYHFVALTPEQVAAIRA